MRKWLLLALLLACGDDDAGLDLDERRFTLQSGREPAPGTTPTLTFDEGQLDFYGGCNSASGSFSIAGGKLVTKDDFGITERGCPTPEQSSQDTFYHGFLSGRPAIALEGSTLTLTIAQVTLTFVEAP